MTPETFTLLLQIAGIAAITSRIMALITYLDSPGKRV